MRGLFIFWSSLKKPSPLRRRLNQKIGLSVLWATHQPAFQRGLRTNGLTPHPGPLHEPVQEMRLTNGLTPHPGPLPIEGRGRIGSQVQGFNVRGFGSEKSHPGPLRKGKRENKTILVWFWFLMRTKKVENCFEAVLRCFRECSFERFLKQ